MRQETAMKYTVYEYKNGFDERFYHIYVERSLLPYQQKPRWRPLRTNPSGFSFNSGGPIAEFRTTGAAIEAAMNTLVNEPKEAKQAERIYVGDFHGEL